MKGSSEYLQFKCGENGIGYVQDPYRFVKMKYPFGFFQIYLWKIEFLYSLMYNPIHNTSLNPQPYTDIAPMHHHICQHSASLLLRAYPLQEEIEASETLPFSGVALHLTTAVVHPSPRCTSQHLSGAPPSKTLDEKPACSRCSDPAESWPIETRLIL